MSATSFEVRNTRTSRLVRTFDAAKAALDFATSHKDALGTLQAYEVTRTVTERPLVAATVTQIRSRKAS